MSPESAPYNTVAPSGSARLESVRYEPLFLVSVIVTAFVALGWLTLVMLGVIQNAAMREAELAIKNADTKLKTAPLQRTINQYEALYSVATQMERIRTKRFLFLPTWEIIKGKVPKDVQFSSVAVGQDNVFRVSGVARSINSVAKFTKELDKTATVSDVQTLAIDKQPNGGVFNFTISFKAVEGKQKDTP